MTTVMVRNAAVRNVLRDVLELWYKNDRKAAKAAIKMIRDQTAQDVYSSGKYKENEGGVEGCVQYRFPAELFWGLRRVFPRWGDHINDIRNLVRDFPDLMPREMRKRIGVNT